MFCLSFDMQYILFSSFAIILTRKLCFNCHPVLPHCAVGWSAVFDCGITYFWIIGVCAGDGLNLIIHMCRNSICK